VTYPQSVRSGVILAAILAIGSPLAAQPAAPAASAASARGAVTAADYARAEKFMPYNVNPLVAHGSVRVNWLPDERFWYRDTTPEGSQFILVDPAKGSRAPAFDHAKLATALAAAVGGDAKFDPAKLPFAQLEFSADSKSVTVNVSGKRWTCAVDGSSCAAAAPRPATVADAAAAGGRRGFARLDAPSPDGTRTAFIKDWNLWVRDIASGKETQLTTDGVKDFGYATDNAGWTMSERPIVLWSPDSKKIATFQQDQRESGEMYLVDTRVGHPHLMAWKYPLPGDDKVTMIQRVIIEVDAPKVIRLKMEPDQHRSTLCDDVACRAGEWSDVEWNKEGTQLAFVSTSRDHKQEWVRIADAATGEVRDVFNEKVDTFFESGNGKVNWRYLGATNEIIWFSERDNWGQLYLYDAKTGALKHQITTGEGNVTQLLLVDDKARVLYFAAVGKEKNVDPYFRGFYRIDMDGKHLKRLTPEPADHDVTLSASGKYFIDNYSTPDTPTVSVLRNNEGKTVVELAKADISKLLATGWKPPTPIRVKARDGVTDLYGLLYKPTNLDPSKKYPIVNKIYPGPQTGSVGGRSFSPGRGDQQALAELGFVVVEIDGMGTPWRSKKFHEAYFADMGDNTLPDQVAGMKQLAAQYAWIDLDRAGIWGHSGGGFAAAGAMFRYPDFFKVGISEAGNHDNRVYEDDWAEKWQGLLQKKPDGTTNYDDQANQNHAKNLKGHLLLAHGTMDSNVPPYNTLLVVNELIKANKDFDLLLLPNRSHGFGSEPYMVRRRWDYFVRYLLGAEPPKEYEMKPSGTPGPVATGPDDDSDDSDDWR
jgi:dipeptidyl-peptidase-4